MCDASDAERMMVLNNKGICRFELVNPLSHQLKNIPTHLAVWNLLKTRLLVYSIKKQTCIEHTAITLKEPCQIKNIFS